jgi:hypothetical protein
MSSKTVLSVLAMIVGITSLILPTPFLPAVDQISADQKAKLKDDQPKKDKNQNSVSVDVIIEEVSLSANIVTARSTSYVIPPHDGTGGAMLMIGATDCHKDQATKYVRLPVMPQAKLAEKKPKVGQRVILRLELLQQEATLVVVGIDEFRGLERIGVNFLDAPGTKDGK